MVHTISSLSAMEALAAQFVRDVSANKEGATVIALSGDLGAGKTTFAQGVAKALGVAGNIQSPTFVIEKRYQLTGKNFSTLVHVDAYRLDSVAELEPLRFHETLSNPDFLALIEWPERIAQALPPRTQTITFTFIDEETRQVTLS